MAGTAVALALVAPSAGAAAEGADIYAERCAVCHQPDGAGLPGSIPPIDGTLGHFASVEQGRGYLIDVLIFGLGGRITVAGDGYFGNMKVMPPLSDEEAAAVLNHVLSTFNAESMPADARPFDAAEVAARRAGPKAPTAVARAREQVMTELQALGLSR